MLERNVSAGPSRPINSTLILVNSSSQRKTRSFRNTSFLGINQVRLSPRAGRRDPGRFIRREKVRVVGVGGGGGGVAEVVDAVDVVEEGEGEVGTPGTGLSRTRTKLRGAITTGNEVMTRR